MKCWTEISEDIFSYFNLEKHNLLKNVDRGEVDLGIFSINSSMLFGLEENIKFLKVCDDAIRKLFINCLMKENYQLYLFVNINIENPNSSIASYLKVWKKIKRKWDITEFNLGPELEIMIRDKMQYVSIAQFDLKSFFSVLNMVSTDTEKFTIIASKSSDLLTIESITSISKYAISGCCIPGDGIDYINISMNLCERGDIIFRWGASADEAELGLIFNKKIMSKLGLCRSLARTPGGHEQIVNKVNIL